MQGSKNTGYTYYTAEPSVMAEIYLPKKAKYQGVLYDTLTNGFQLNRYADHFIGDKANEIKSFLEEFDVDSDDKYDTIIAMHDQHPEEERVFYGYSIYEVDGVFFKPRHVNKENEQISEARIDEERTQFIRLIFMPNYEWMAKKLHEKDDVKVGLRELNLCMRHFLRHNISNRFVTKEKYDKAIYRTIVPNFDDAKIHKIVKKLQQWRDHVGIFLIGYIMFELSVGVIGQEDEIWLTSFWNFNVNRVVRNKENKY